MELSVPELGPTTRLVSLPALALCDAATGAPARLATHLRLATRGGRLLLRFDCRHRGIVATMTRGNDPLWKEDVVEAFLAFEDPPRHYLELEVNPRGARFSARVTSPNLGRPGMTVEPFEFPEFTAEARVHPNRWSAVLRIGFSISSAGGLRAPQGPWPASPLAGPGFRANFFRIDRTTNEFSALFPTRASPPDFHVPPAFGRLRWRRSVRTRS